MFSVLNVRACGVECLPTCVDSRWPRGREGPRRRRARSRLGRDGPLRLLSPGFVRGSKNQAWIRQLNQKHGGEAGGGIFVTAWKKPQQYLHVHTREHGHTRKKTSCLIPHLTYHSCTWGGWFGFFCLFSRCIWPGSSRIVKGYPNPNPFSCVEGLILLFLGRSSLTVYFAVMEGKKKNMCNFKIILTDSWVLRFCHMLKTVSLRCFSEERRKKREKKQPYSLVLRRKMTSFCRSTLTFQSWKAE